MDTTARRVAPGTISDRALVTALEESIARRIGTPRFNLWFHRHTEFAWDDDVLTVGVPNLHFQEWLSKTFTEDVRDAAEEVFGQAMDVVFRIDPQLFQAARREQAAVEEKSRPPAPPKPKEEPSPTPLVEKPAPPSRKRRWHKLSEFVVGPCNRVAYAAALSVTEAPGQGANPLVLHGPTGTGKTHLLEGIYAGLRKTDPQARVLYTTAEEFTNRFLQAMHHGKLSSFRKHYRDCDALLVDDLHFLAGKKATETEFLHTFDALLSEERQLVLTCDCHPRLTEQFSHELTDRLLGGALWSLTPPDADTRLAILRAKTAKLPDTVVPDDVLRHLAGQLRGNVRELEGAIQSLRHFSRVTGRRIDIALAREALAELLRHAVRVVQIADIEMAVCRVLRLDAKALQSKQRAWSVSHPRMLAMFLARKHTSGTYGDIGSHFGGRNHSTAVAAEKRVRQWLAEDGELVLGERRVRVKEVIELVERELLR